MDTTSVVLATYNGASFLSLQLQSILMQSEAPHELIIADDCSSDSTLEIVERFAASAPFPVTVIRNSANVGYGKNFIDATKYATGDLVAFCDQDDVWSSEKIRVCREIIDDTGADLVVHRASLIDANGRPLGLLKQGISRDTITYPLTMSPWQVFYGCTMVFSRERLFEAVDSDLRGPHTFEYEGLLSHDLWITFLATSLFKTVLLTRELVQYRQHASNVTPSVLSSGPRAWFRQLGLPADSRLGRNRIAQYRADLMQRAADGAQDEIKRQSFQRAAEWWVMVAQHEEGRATLYGDRKLYSRIFVFCKLLLAGAYGSPKSSGLGARLLLKDLVVGVCLGGRRLTK